jgi:phosphoserine phosphatase
MSKIVIFDLDGTLALVDHRRPILEDKTKSSDERWREFYAACIHDEPNEPVIELARVLKDAGFYVVIFSGRSNEVEEETAAWLETHRVPFDELRMRSAGDYTTDHLLKAEWLKSLDKSKILCVFDDRDSVVRMWRESGVTCLQVAPGAF